MISSNLSSLKLATASSALYSFELMSRLTDSEILNPLLFCLNIISGSIPKQLSFIYFE